MRIVSLLPSATEIVCALGLRDHLVGVTHECDHPADVRTLPAVTRTRIPHDATSREIDDLVRAELAADTSLYLLERETLEQLAPDLIITQALCDVCAVNERDVAAVACRLPGPPRVVNLEPMTLAAVFDSMRAVAAAAGVSAETVVGEYERRVAAVRDAVVGRPRPRVGFIEWIDPPFSGGHWNPELVRLAGGIDGLGVEGQASRTLEWSEVIAWAPEVIVIAACGFSRARALEELHVLESRDGWGALPAVQSGRVHVVDGNQYFSRPGPRLVESLEILAGLLNPGALARGG